MKRRATQAGGRRPARGSPQAAPHTASHAAPRAADGPATRAALLASGRRLFALRGYDGASVRAITHEARANLGAVTYHFGSKHALYEAVLEQVITPIAGRVAEALDGPGDTLARCERTVRAFFEHFEVNPDMPQLMLQEIAAGKRPPPPVARVLGLVIRRLGELVVEGQKAGEIRAGGPLLMALSIVAQPVHLTLVRRLAQQMVGLDQSDPSTHVRVVEHAARFARAGIVELGAERSR